MAPSSILPCLRVIRSIEAVLSAFGAYAAQFGPGLFGHWTP
jgi:hypothetical protein